VRGGGEGWGYGIRHNLNIRQWNQSSRMSEKDKQVISNWKN